MEEKEKTHGPNHFIDLNCLHFITIVHKVIMVYLVLSKKESSWPQIIEALPNIFLDLKKNLCRVVGHHSEEIEECGSES